MHKTTEERSKKERENTEGKRGRKRRRARRGDRRGERREKRREKARRETRAEQEKPTKITYIRASSSENLRLCFRWKNNSPP
jgi:hypothetical protein